MSGVQGIEIKKEFLIILGTVIWIVCFFIKYIKHRNTTSKKMLLSEILKLGLILYLSLLIGVTLLPIRLPSITMYNIEPVINLNIFSILDYGFNKYAIINIIGNVLLLAPLPILLFLNGYNKLTKVKNVLFFPFVISLLIEILQYFEAYFNLVYVPRATDVLDLILNTAGGFLGYCILRIYQKSINSVETLENELNHRAK